jgi:WD40 repeat protein
VSASWDKTLRVWDLETGICLVIAVTPGLTMAMALSPMLGRVIAGTSTGEILQFDLRGIPLTASSQVT